MVRVYKRKTNRQSWSDEQMQKAIQKLLDGHKCKSVANEFGIPRSTLQKRIKEISNNSSQTESNLRKGKFL